MCLPPFVPPGGRDPPHNTDSLCACRCHDTRAADDAALVPWFIRVHSSLNACALRRDPLAAAVACPRCLNLHAVVFEPPPPEPSPPVVPPSNPFPADTEDD